MKLPINEIKPNPNNPRYIKDDKFKKLVQSLKDFPEMADVREIVVNKDHVILGGNMRFKAMQEAGWTEAPVKVVDWSEEKQKEFIVKDNVAGGEWDYDVLANEWDIEELNDWGLDDAALKINANLKNIDDLYVDFDSFDLMVVNPPEAPRLKERFELNFDKIEKYQVFKDKYRDNPQQLIDDLGL